MLTAILRNRRWLPLSATAMFVLTICMLVAPSAGHAQGLTFGPPTRLANFSNINNVNASIGAQGDFDEDGSLDVVVVRSFPGNGPSDPTRLFFLFGNGTGGIRNAAEIQPVGARNTYALKLGDVNNDGHLDIVTANNGSRNVAVVLGNGHGNFASSVYPVWSFWGGRAVGLGDLNGDGYLDIIGGSSGGETTVLLNNGNGAFAVTANYVDSAAWSQNDVAVADLDGDGDNDVVASDVANVDVFLNDGFGALTRLSTKPINVPTGEFLLEDFDGDGAVDIAAPNLNTIRVYPGNGNGTFGVPTDYLAGFFGSGPVASADFDGDGHSDLATADFSSNKVAVLLGDGSGSFGDRTLVPSVATNDLQRPTRVLTGDMNGDEKPDLFVLNHDSGPRPPFASIMLNTTEGPSDTTPPVITSSISGTLGNNGWYTSDVTVVWAVTDPESPFTTSGCGTQSVTTDTTGVTFTCSATSAGGLSSASLTIKRDSTGPVIASATADRSTLWPPNNKMSSVTIDVDANDAGAGLLACQIVTVSVNEGVSNQEPDTEVTGSLTLDLRAEREGNGSGRTYEIEVSCRDAAGNESATSVIVTVPHDQGNGAGKGK